MKRFWITNFILFQASWFCAAFYTPYANLGLLALLMLHLALSPSRRADIKVISLVLVGLLVDSLHLSMGTFSAQSSGFPLWLALLWCQFVVSLNHSLHWLVSKPLWVVGLFGAVGGTSSYMAGAKAGALQLGGSVEATALTLFVAWGVVLTLLVLAYRQLDPLDENSARADQLKI
jgi:hypothetical protein